MNRMKHFVDDDILYIQITENEEVNSFEISPNITAEVDSNNELIGIEILNASTYLRDTLMESVQAKLSQVIKK